MNNTKFTELKENIEQWASDKGILTNGTPLAQSEKTLEEAQEIKDAIVENNRDELIDGIGDTLVTLIVQAKMNNLDIIECLESAYNVIKNRTGKMIDGQFVKN